MESSEGADHTGLIADFCALTGASDAQATQYLQAHDWSLSAAAASYFEDQEDGEAPPPAPRSRPEPEPEYTGPRTLDGRPAPQSALGGRAAAASKPQPKKKGIATLGSLGGGGHSHGHDHDDDDEGDEDYDDEDERRGPRDLFAGGEKSGLAVQDPAQQSGSSHKKIIQDILSKAKANSRPDAAASSSSEPSRFRGSGQTLGGDGVASRTIPDPAARPGTGSRRPGGSGQAEETQERVLHLWQDGFSIDDGELRSFDDPNNAMELEMIRQGRAPLHLMNVSYDQPVDVKLQQHDENWRPLPKQYRPFGGEGRRLGSPVPGAGSAVAPPPPAAASSSTQSRTAAAPATEVDSSQPTLMLRIQMPDGTRLPARFNTTQTVGDVYAFVTRASSDLVGGRPWVLATTFPNKSHTDKGLVLGEMPEFKKGGTAVVKWS